MDSLHSAQHEMMNGGTGSLADMALEEAEVLAKNTGYAFELCDCDGLNPVNWADASAFFLEGYLYAKKQLAGG